MQRMKAIARSSNKPRANATVIPSERRYMADLLA
jgi:hypothetical protein